MITDTPQVSVLKDSQDKKKKLDVSKKAEEFKKDVMSKVHLLFFFALAAISIYSVLSPSVCYYFVSLGLSLLLGLACLLCGIILGFIFAIPRYVSDPDLKFFQPNANLEQISDWLTKIIVGVGLVELTSIIQKLKQLVNYLEPSFIELPHPKAYVFSLIVFYFVYGFLLGYLYTRIFLPTLFKWAEGLLENRIDRLEEENRFDREVYEYVGKILSVFTTKSSNEDVFKDTVKKISSATKSTIYFRARDFRKRQEDKYEYLSDKLVEKLKYIKTLDSEKKVPFLHTIDFDKALTFEIKEIVTQLNQVEMAQNLKTGYDQLMAGEILDAIEKINDIVKQIEINIEALQRSEIIYVALIEDNKQSIKEGSMDHLFSSNFAQLGHIYFNLGKLEQPGKRDQFFDKAILYYQTAINERSKEFEGDSYYELWLVLAKYFREKGSISDLENIKITLLKYKGYPPFELNQDLSIILSRVSLK